MCRSSDCGENSPRISTQGATRFPFSQVIPFYSSSFRELLLLNDFFFSFLIYSDLLNRSVELQVRRSQRRWPLQVLKMGIERFQGSPEISKNSPVANIPLGYLKGLWERNESSYLVVPGEGITAR